MYCHSADFLPAKFNLGLAYQQLHQWTEAIQIYNEVSSGWGAAAHRQHHHHHHHHHPSSRKGGGGAAAADGGQEKSEVDMENEILMEARVRQCDLLQAMGDYQAAQDCWEEGLRQWPSSALMYVWFDAHQIALL